MDGHNFFHICSACYFFLDFCFENFESMYYKYSNDQREAYDAHSRNDYAKFVLLGTARTGSTWLLSLLKSHSRVVVYGEIFEYSNNFLTNLIDDLPYPLFSFETREYFDSLRFCQPVDLLEKFVFRGYVTNQVGAVGFKLFYDQPEDDLVRDELWNRLLSDSSIHFIHLKRRNYLRMLASLEIANATNRWVGLPDGGVDPNFKPIFLSYRTCLDFFFEIERFEQIFDEKLSESNVLTVYYEDLIKDVAKTGEVIQNFLHLDYQTLESPLQRQNSQPLSSLIVNYFDLLEAFSGSRWEHFFDDID